MDGNHFLTGVVFYYLYIMGRGGKSYDHLTLEDKINLRRDSDDRIFIPVVKGKVYIQRPELKKQKEFIKKEGETFNFLQYVGIVYDWAMANYKISRPQVDLVLYLHPLGIFTREEAYKTLELWPCSKYMVLEKLINKGMIYTVQYSKDSRNRRQPVYSLTNKATMMVNIFYKKVTGERKFATSHVSLGHINKNASKDFKYDDIIGKFNQMVKDKNDET